MYYNLLHFKIAIEKPVPNHALMFVFIISPLFSCLLARYKYHYSHFFRFQIFR